MRQRGFTLIEMVMVIVITAIVATVVARFIVEPVKGYFSTAARAALTENADAALRTIARDLRIALPNSARVNAAGTALELIPTTGAARYATEGSGALQFGVVDTSFDLVGPPLTVTAAQQLVFYNLGYKVTGSDAYAPNGTAAEQASSNRRMATNAAGSASTLTLSSLAGLPVGDFAPPYRVFAVGQPVSYRCDTAAGTLTRTTGYGFAATQPDPPAGGSSSLVATGVVSNGCSFSYDANGVGARAGLITLRLALSATPATGGTETVSLVQAIHVDNLP
jgi:MSHA biogenesis protein MshO